MLCFFLACWLTFGVTYVLELVLIVFLGFYQVQSDSTVHVEALTMQAKNENLEQLTTARLNSTCVYL
jgi:hypothetical protein